MPYLGRPVVAPGWDAFRKHVVAPALRRAVDVGARDRHPGATGSSRRRPSPRPTRGATRSRSYPRAIAGLRFVGRVDRRRGAARRATSARSCTALPRARPPRMDNGRGCSQRRARWTRAGRWSSSTRPTSRCRRASRSTSRSTGTLREHVQLRRARDRDDGVERLQRPVFDDHPDYLPYTAWRNTPGEDRDEATSIDRARRPPARREAVDVRRRAARLDDGWTTSRGTLIAGRSYRRPRRPDTASSSSSRRSTR